MESSFHLGHAPQRGLQRSDDDLFNILVLGNFSGRRGGGTRLDQRESIRVDGDSFDAAFGVLTPSLALDLGGSAATPVEVSFTSLDDFEPDVLFARLPLFERMRDLRRRLTDPTTFTQAAAEMRDVPARPENVATGAFVEDDAATLERLLGRPPVSGERTGVVQGSGDESPIARLVRQLVAPHIVPATAHLQQPLIESLDLAISASMRALLRHPDWQALEGLWRSVDRFVRNVDMEGAVVLELFDVGADELFDDLARAQGGVADTAIGKMLAGRRAGAGPDENPSLLVGCFTFGSSAAEMALLAGLGAIAMNAGAVYLDAAAPALLESTAARSTDGADGADGRHDPQAASRWRTLRESAVAPAIGLVWPNVLARLPYGKKTQPVAAFDFDELGDGFAHERLLWRSASLDCAGLLAQGFNQHGWQMEPNGHLDLDDLPAYVDRSESPPRLQAVAETFLSEPGLRAVQAQGVMPIVSHRSLPRARLAGWHSIALGADPLAGLWQRRA